MKKYGWYMYKGQELENRLVDFAVSVIYLTKKLPKSYVGVHIIKQIIRSSTSTAANYGEAQFAESKADFVHKLKIVLKELQETKIWLMTIKKANLISSIEPIERIIQENGELVSIFVTSVKTTRHKD